MDFISVVEKLNALSRENPDNENSAEFVFGDFIEKAAYLLSKIAPQGKCAFIGLEDTVLKTGEKLSSAIKALGGKIVIASEKRAFPIGSAECAGLFNLPDDIRLVICADTSLFAAASYFATVRRVPVIKAFSPRCAGSVLLSSSDGFAFGCKNYVVIPKDAIKKADAAYLYGYCISKLVSLIDYRFDFKIRNRKVDAYCYNIAKKAVTDVFPLCKDADNVDAGGLILCALSVALSDYMLGGELFGYGAPEEVLRLIKPDSLDESRYAFWTAVKSIGVYAAAAEGTLRFVPDYNERAEKLAAEYGETEEEALKRFKIQIAFFKNNRREIESFVKKIAPEIKSYAALTDSIVKRYISLGGKYLTESENRKINAALRFAGDCKFNFASYARERGITEII